MFSRLYNQSPQVHEDTSKKLKHALEGTKRDTVRQTLLTAALGFSHSGTFIRSVSTYKKKNLLY